MDKRLKPSVLTEDVAIVIRTVGERTLDLCHHLATQQVPAEHIAVIQEMPFAHAVRRTFEVGIEVALPWTIALDADVLLRPNAVAALIRHVQQLPDAAFGAQLPVLDKFFGFPRGGVHCYRTAFLATALRYVPNVEESMRPETFVKRRMVDAGHPWLLLEDRAVGLHAYEQYYADIYRTCFMHARKNARYVEQLLPWWIRAAGDDADFRVALWGFRAGKILDGYVGIDASLFQGSVEPWLSATNLQEKAALDAASYPVSVIESAIDVHEPTAESGSVAAMMRTGSRAFLSGLNDLRQSHPTRRRVRDAVTSIGRRIQGIGSRIVRWSER